MRTERRHDRPHSRHPRHRLSGQRKTTLVNRILAERGEEKIAVIENGFGKVSIDHALLAHEAEIVEINDGCVCCSVREQVAFADVLLIGNCDRTDEKQFSGLLQRLIRINPRAVIHAMSHGDVPMHVIVDVNAFNLTSLLEIDPVFLDDAHHHHHDDIAAFVYRNERVRPWPLPVGCRTPGTLAAG